MKKIIISLAIFAAAIAANAQGFRGGMMGGMQNNPLMLLVREDVQEDLGLNDDQKLKVAEYFAPDAMRQRMMSVFQNSGLSREDFGTDEGRKKMQELMTKQMEGMKKEVEGYLTPAQVTRVMQISLQVNGFRSIMQKDVAKALEVTKEQQEKIDNLQKASGDAMRALGEKMRNQELTMEEMQEKSKKNAEIMNTELGKILTENQKAKFIEMGGKKFVPKEGSN